jgi:hypothetical protein
MKKARFQERASCGLPGPLTRKVVRFPYLLRYPVCVAILEAADGMVFVQLHGPTAMVNENSKALDTLNKRDSTDRHNRINLQGC